MNIEDGDVSDNKESKGMGHLNTKYMDKNTQKWVDQNLDKNKLKLTKFKKEDKVAT